MAIDSMNENSICKEIPVARYRGTRENTGIFVSLTLKKRLTIKYPEGKLKKARMKRENGTDSKSSNLKIAPLLKTIILISILKSYMEYRIHTHVYNIATPCFVCQMTRNKWVDLNVLVTGGASFIGSHLVDKLLSLGAKVTVIDNLRSGKIENLENAIDHVK
ncbi:MAG: NAD-dependent epimerase/dehydratase family protein, partial [Nitrososphaerales archaeon]